MKIYGSTQYVDILEEKEYFQLEVINMWDFKTRTICFKEINGEFISYCLNKYIALNNLECKKENITELTQEMKKEIIKMGYILKK